MTFTQARYATGLGPEASVHNLAEALGAAIYDYRHRVALSPTVEVRNAYQQHVDYLNRTLASLQKHGRKVFPWEKPGFQGKHPDGEENLRREQARAIYWEGWQADEKGSHERAAELYRQAAAAGEVDGYISLALLYERGVTGVPQDHEEATRLYRIAAALGRPQGLAGMYARGLGIQGDSAVYLSLDLHQARFGEDWARFLMGRRYEEGWSVEHDKREAVWWYRLGWARQDFIYNLSALERMGEYENGRPVIR
jgi:TPR repeat protein